MTVPGEQGSAEPATRFGGLPDGLDRLWVAHRQAYVSGAAHPRVEEGDPCPFCAAPTGPDEEHLIVRRGRVCYALLNLYPYNAGHLLVCPYRHVPDYTDLTGDETVELAELTRQAMRVLRAVSRPRGFNIGMNQGDVAGAGIAAHLHQHVVPRWAGDANFFPIIARTKAVPQILWDTRRVVAQAWIRVVDEESGS